MVAYDRGLFRRDSNYSYSVGEILVVFFSVAYVRWLPMRGRVPHEGLTH